MTSASSENIQSNGATALEEPSHASERWWEKAWAIGIGMTLLAAGLLLLLLWHHANPPVATDKPIVFTDTVKDTTANPDVLTNWKKTPVPAGATDPKTLDGYRQVSSKGNVTYTVPVDGECATTNGTIQTPSDYTHACYVKHDKAVIFAASSLVNNPRVGAFSHIRNLSVGQIVTIDSFGYKVKSVQVLNAKSLPDYLFSGKNIALLTGHVDTSTKTAKDVDQVDVVVLGK